MGRCLETGEKVDPPRGGTSKTDEKSRASTGRHQFFGRKRRPLAGESSKRARLAVPPRGGSTKTGRFNGASTRRTEFFARFDGSSSRRNAQNGLKNSCLHVEALQKRAKKAVAPGGAAVSAASSRPTYRRDAGAPRDLTDDQANRQWAVREKSWTAFFVLYHEP